MSINQLLNITRRSFIAFDAAMNTIGQNVANAGSEGYSRRRVALEADSTATLGLFNRGVGPAANGNGVNLTKYERVRDDLLGRSSWHASGFMGASEEVLRIAAAIESIFTVQTEGSLSNQLNEFWNAWSDLADNPTDNGVRLALRAQGSSVAATLNRMAADLTHLREETDNVLRGHIKDINKMLNEVAELNDVIARSTYAGSPDLASEDRRDLLASKLSELAGIRVHVGDKGDYRISLGGMNLVAGTTVSELSLDTSSGLPEVKIGNSPNAIIVPPEGGGKLGGVLRSATSHLPNTLTALDSIAETLVKEVNALHSTGFDLDGNTGVDFFHYAAGPPEQGIQASNIRLSDAVQASSRAIVASQGDPSAGVNDSIIANGIMDLRESKLMNANTETIEAFAINLVSGMGAVAERASNLYESNASFANHLEAMSEGVSAVSLEEEMTHLIQFQQAFAASARVLNAAEKMMDTLLAM